MLYATLIIAQAVIVQIKPFYTKVILDALKISINLFVMLKT